MLESLICSCYTSAAAAAAAAPPAPPLDDYNHIFWECPAVAGAVRWLWQLWEDVEGSAPPWRPEVLVEGAWQPATCRQLWQHMRVALLYAMWQLRQRRRRTGVQHGSAAIVAAAVAALQRTIEEDYAAASGCVWRMSGYGQRWFWQRRQRGLPSSLPEFQQLWCVGGVLARVDGAGLHVSVPSAIPDQAAAQRWGAAAHGPAQGV